MKAYRRERQTWSDRAPAGDGLRVVSAGLLLAWGVSLGLSGLGLGHTLAARYFNYYWALPELECLLDALARGQRQLAAQAAAAGAEALDRFGRPAEPSLPYIIPK